MSQPIPFPLPAPQTPDTVNTVQSEDCWGEAALLAGHATASNANSNLLGILGGLEIGEILQVLSYLGKTGRLTIASAAAKGVIDLQYGKIIHAESNRKHQRIGEVLTAMGFINEHAFERALRRQAQSQPHKRIGEILVELGEVTKPELKEAVRCQISDAVEEIMSWKHGVFRFEVQSPSKEDEIGLDALDLYILEGMEVENLLLRILVKRDQANSEAVNLEPESTIAPGVIALQSAVLGDNLAPKLNDRLVKRLLDLASTYFDRAILFRHNQRRLTEVSRSGGFPAATADGTREEVFLPADQDSVLSPALRTQKTYFGGVKNGHWNSYLMYQLGGQPAQEVLVIPAAAADQTEYLLYCDNAVTGRPLETCDALEVLMKQIGKALEAKAIC